MLPNNINQPAIDRLRLISNCRKFYQNLGIPTLVLILFGAINHYPPFHYFIMSLPPGSVLFFIFPRQQFDTHRITSQHNYIQVHFLLSFKEAYFFVLNNILKSNVAQLQTTMKIILNSFYYYFFLVQFTLS